MESDDVQEGLGNRLGIYTRQKYKRPNKNKIKMIKSSKRKNRK